MEANIPIILCKLERIFPPSFFDSMEHLPIHLPYEARIGGPVQYRWMYPFERFLNKIKRTVKNKACVEGSICQAYLAQEISYFSSHYFESHVQCSWNRVQRNDDGVDDHVRQPTLSIFNSPRRIAGKSTTRWLTDKEVNAAQLHVLLNCEEVKEYLNMYVHHLRSQYGNISDSIIDNQIEADFPRWMREYVIHHSELMSRNPHLLYLALGPLRVAKSWPVMLIGGYKFHTTTRSEGKKTFNSGVCLKGTSQDSTCNDYYGILKEILELEWPGEPLKSLMTGPSNKNGCKSKKNKGKKRLMEEINFQTPPHTLQALQNDLPPIIPSAALLSQLQTNPNPNPPITNTQPPQSNPLITNSLPPPQPNPLQPNPHNQHIGDNQTPGTSCSGVGGSDNSEGMLFIEPDGDEFAPHKPVIQGIASCIKSKFDIGEPRWKKFSAEIRDIWFAEFKKKFKWAPRFNQVIRENFEKRGSSKLSQLLQNARKTGVRPSWIGESAWADLLMYWQSDEFKLKSEQNKKNRNSSEGSSLHTGGSIPHRVHFKRMKDERGGVDPSFEEFYFRTHKKKNRECVHQKSQDAYENFEKKKGELSSQSTANSDNITGDEDTVAQSQPIPPDLHIYVNAIGGKKKGRVRGLGSLGRSMNVFCPGTSQMETIPEEVEERIRSEVQSFNASLQAQLEKEKKEKEDMRKELGETRRMLDDLMERLGYKQSSSKPQEDHQKSRDDEDSSYEGTSEEGSSDEVENT